MRIFTIRNVERIRFYWSYIGSDPSQMRQSFKVKIADFFLTEILMQ